MQVLLNTDSHIRGTENLNEFVENMAQDVLSRFSKKITRVEVHVQDVNGEKGGQDIKCSIEARIAGVKATAATHEDISFQTAVAGAFEKLNRTIEHTMGRLNAR